MAEDSEIRVPPGGDVHRRLDRIEHRLDQIAILLERLTRVEEQLHHANESYHTETTRLNLRVDEVFHRTERLELLHADTALIIKWAQMIFWLIIAGALMLVGKHVFEIKNFW